MRVHACIRIRGVQKVSFSGKRTRVGITMREAVYDRDRRRARFEPLSPSVIRGILKFFVETFFTFAERRKSRRFSLDVCLKVLCLEL